MQLGLLFDSQATNKKEESAPAAAEASTSHSERAREPGVKYASYPLGVHKMAP